MSMMISRDRLRTSPRVNPRRASLLLDRRDTFPGFVTSARSLTIHPKSISTAISPHRRLNPVAVRVTATGSRSASFPFSDLPDRDKQIDIAAVKDRSTLEAACLERLQDDHSRQAAGFLNDKPLEWTVEKTQIEHLGSTHFHLFCERTGGPDPARTSVEIVDTNFEGVPGPYRSKIALDGRSECGGRVHRTQATGLGQASIPPVSTRFKPMFRLDGTARPSTGPAISPTEGSANSPNADSRERLAAVAGR